MTKEQHKDILNKLLTAESQADRSALLSELETDYGSILAENADAVATAEKLKTENATFAEINNKLFLQVGAVKKEIDGAAVEEETVEEPPKKLSYDDLKFD